MMLREAKENLVDGIYIRFRTDGNVFNLRRLLAQTTTIEEPITELLFADDGALLAHTQEALQYIADRFAEAAKAFVLTISLMKTEVMYQSPPREAYSPPRISIDDTNAVEQFTYLGSVIFNDATIQTKDRNEKRTKKQNGIGTRKIFLLLLSGADGSLHSAAEVTRRSRLPMPLLPLFQCHAELPVLCLQTTGQTIRSGHDP
ncbi:hypothetical protein ACOMHN_059931 [Nucella lapillus]